MQNIKANKAFLLGILGVFIISCSTRSFETIDELYAYISDEENDLFQEKSINGVDFALQYRPTDVLVHQTIGDSISQEQIEALREQYSKNMYFNLSMSSNNQELLNHVVHDKNKFGALVNDLAFGMDQKVHLFTPKKDTLEMLDFVYPRMYGMTRSTQIMIVFPRDQKSLKEKHLYLTIEDLGFNTGEVKFRIPTDPINNEPQLNFH